MISIIKGDGNWLDTQNHIHEICIWEGFEKDKTHNRLCMIVLWSSGVGSQVEITRVGKDKWYYDDECFGRNIQEDQ